MKIGRIMAYTLAGILFVGYVGILWWARTPDVSDVYRMYYIDHELQEWPGEDGISFISGEWEYLGVTNGEEEKASKRMGRGWSHREAEGRWTDGNQVRMWYRIPEGEQSSSFQLACDIVACITPEPVLVYAGDILMGEISPSQSGTVLFSVPANCTDENGVLEIVLYIQQTVVPTGGNDNRELGVMIYKIKMEKDGMEYDK